MDPVELSEVIRNYAIVIGGAVGLGLAIWRGIALSRQAKASEEQARIARRTHITEVYSDAIGNLGNDKLEIRLGAIHALERIGKDFPEFEDSVVEVLSAYARDRTPAGREPEIDLREIVRIIRDYQAREGAHESAKA